MTMLDRMRRHKGWLKWSLALVVLTFVVFYIPDFLTPGVGAVPGDDLAQLMPASAPAASEASRKVRRFIMWELPWLRRASRARGRGGCR